MIESIRISGCATFTGEPSVLTDLRKVNYFFGMNGSGRPTASRVIGRHINHGGRGPLWRCGAEARILAGRPYSVRACVSESGEKPWGPRSLGNVPLSLPAVTTWAL